MTMDLVYCKAIASTMHIGLGFRDKTKSFIDRLGYRIYRRVYQACSLSDIMIVSNGSAVSAFLQM